MCIYAFLYIYIFTYPEMYICGNVIRTGDCRYVYHAEVWILTALHAERGVKFLEDLATIMVHTQPVASAGHERSEKETLEDFHSHTRRSDG
jgi:hypothetical protein